MTANEHKSENELAARACARYIWSTQGIEEEYESHVEAEGDPREHILYKAAVVLDLAHRFQDGIVDWETSIEAPNSEVTETTPTDEAQPVRRKELDQPFAQKLTRVAQEIYQSDDCAVDPIKYESDISAADGGIWVSAWVWVCRDLLAEEKQA